MYCADELQEWNIIDLQNLQLLQKYKAIYILHSSKLELFCMHRLVWKKLPHP